MAGLQAQAHLSKALCLLCSPVPSRSFPRGGGLQEWRNAIVLFVNLPGPGEPAAAAAARRPYANQWLWLPPAGGAGAAAEPVLASGLEAYEKLAAGWRLALTWWTGRGYTAEHPVVQRLLAAGAVDGAAVGATAGQGGGSGGSAGGAAQSVLLFCRAGSQPYIFCGRLQAADVDAAASGSGARITWSLADAEALLLGGGGAAFRQLL